MRGVDNSVEAGHSALDMMHNGGMCLRSLIYIIQASSEELADQVFFTDDIALQ